VGQGAGRGVPGEATGLSREVNSWGSSRSPGLLQYNGRGCLLWKIVQYKSTCGVMKEKPMGMLWMMRRFGGALFQDYSAARKDLPEGRLAARMNKFTLLDDAVRAFWGPRQGPMSARLTGNGGRESKTVEVSCCCQVGSIRADRFATLFATAACL